MCFSLPVLLTPVAEERGVTHKEARLAMQGKLEEAEPLFGRAIAIWEEALESGHPKVGVALNDWAKVLKTQVRGTIFTPGHD